MNDNLFESVDCIVCGENDLQKISEKGQFNIPTHVCICKKDGQKKNISIFIAMIMINSIDQM